MSIIERTELRQQLTDLRLLRDSFLQAGQLHKAHQLARSIRQIKRQIARDRENGCRYLRDESRMVLGV